MKISNVTATVVTVPTTRPCAWSGGNSLGCTRTIIEIETDSGLVGLGEAPWARSARIVSEKFAPILIGKEFLERATLRKACLSDHEDYGSIGDPMLEYAWVGVEIALWDLLGKHLGKPLYRVLGGAVRERAPFILRLTDEYLATIRKLTSDLGIVLIFDEVFCFRYGYNGAQGQVGITPDLTTLGKIIGGGIPIGAVGGRKDIMELFDPAKGSAGVEHTGTFNANPLAMAAGYACMKQLNREAFENLDTLGTTLRDEIRKHAKNSHVPLQV